MSHSDEQPSVADEQPTIYKTMVPSKDLTKLLSFLRPQDRTMIFVDGASTYVAARALQFDIDYAKLYDLFNINCNLIRANYFTHITNDYLPYRPICDWLRYNRYTVTTKLVDTVENIRPKQQGWMQVETTVAILEACHSSTAPLNTIILASGDGEFTPLAAAIKRLGIKLLVISTTKTNPVIMASSLRQEADVFIDLVDLQPLIFREQTTKRITVDRINE